MAQGTPRVVGPCPECGTDVVYSGWGRMRFYCSQKCNQRVQNRRARRRLRPKAPLPSRLCRCCGTEYMPKQSNSVWCSWRCYKLGNSRRPKFQRERRVCAECGDQFEAWRYDQRFCATACSRAFHGRARGRRRRTYAVRSGYVDRDIFDRDGWMCWLCNEPVDPTISRLHRDGATIDHVFPLALGGTDDPDNIRTAHRGCNNQKGTRLVA
jgi:hypothetical protein